MLAIDLSLDVFTNIKDTIRISVPGPRSSHRVEAAARGLGFSTHAALRAALSEGDRRVPVDGGAFQAFLAEVGNGADGASEAFLDACAVQAILSTVRRHPDLPVGTFVVEEIRTGEAPDWANHRARHVAGEFLGAVACLRDPVFRARLPRYAGAEAIAASVRSRARNRVRWPVAMQAALHEGLPLMEPQMWAKGIPSFLVMPPHPQAGHVHPDWIGPLLALGEIAKDEARSRFLAAAERGEFDAAAAETLIKALWCRAFGNHLDRVGIPGWQDYGRMLLVDPGLWAFGPAGSADGLRRTRGGVEALCGGDAIPGVKPGYTYVFEGRLKDLMESPRPRRKPVRAQAAEEPAEEAPPPRP